MAKKKSTKKSARKRSKKSSKKSSTRSSMSKSRASKVLRSGRSGKSAKSSAALALSGRQSRAARRASGKTRMYDRNTEKPWTAAEVREFRQLVKGNTPTRVIGLKLGRTEDAVYDKARSLRISLMPANQPPNLGRKTSRGRRR